MQIGMITGHTRVCGKSQGFLGLPLRDEVLQVEGMGTVHQMTTAWFPTPAEIAAIQAGAPIHVSIWGSPHPQLGVPLPSPMKVEVGNPPDPL
jgi:hypothetical protein